MAELGAREAAAMRVLWQADRPMTVREVLAELNQGRSQPLAYTTVMTILTRLADKGALTREMQGRGYAYAPAVPDEAALAVRSVLAEHGDAAIAHFVDQVGADPAAVRRLRRLVQQPSRRTTS